MARNDKQARETEGLRERLTKLSETSLRINETLELDNVLHEVIESARHLTSAPYGVLTTLDESGPVEEFLSSGLTHEENKQLWALLKGRTFSHTLSSLSEPLRVSDIHSHIVAQGLPVFHIPVKASSFLTAPIRQRGQSLSYIFLAKKQ